MTKAEYENNIILLTTAINENKCILLLGPGLITSKEPVEPLINLFGLHLKESNKNIPSDEDNLRSITLSYIEDKVKAYSGSQRVTMKMLEMKSLVNKFATFSNDNFFINEFHEKLAEMNFRLVINVTPDEKLYQTLFSKYDFGIYDFRNDQEKKVELNKDSSKDSPDRIFYNLFGSFRNTQSIPITESDFIKFTTCFIKDSPAVHPRVKNILNEIGISFLFLGFDLNSWYLKVLINVLNVMGGINLESSFFPISNLNKAFFTNEHEFAFVNKNLEEFVNDLNIVVAPKTKQKEQISKKQVLLLFAQQDANYVSEFEINIKSIADLIHENNIELGNSSIEDKLKSEMNNVEIVAIFSSSNFYASDRCIKLLKIAEANNKKIVNILLSSCPFETNLEAILEKYPYPNIQTLPSGNKAITEIADTAEKRATLFTKISEEIKNS